MLEELRDHLIAVGMDEILADEIHDAYYDGGTGLARQYGLVSKFNADEIERLIEEWQKEVGEAGGRSDGHQGRRGGEGDAHREGDQAGVQEDQKDLDRAGAEAAGREDRQEAGAVDPAPGENLLAASGHRGDDRVDQQERRDGLPQRRDPQEVMIMSPAEQLRRARCRALAMTIDETEESIRDDPRLTRTRNAGCSRKF